jgi:hypothetical protein
MAQAGLVFVRLFRVRKVGSDHVSSERLQSFYHLVGRYGEKTFGFYADQAVQKES